MASTTTETSTAPEGTSGPAQPGGEHGVLEAHHPSDWTYVKVAIILGAITALEILFYVIEDDLPRALVVYGLLGMMAVKFVIVASYFMHLKYDNPIFKRVFYFGLVLAIAVYIIAMASFWYFSDDFFRFLR